MIPTLLAGPVGFEAIQIGDFQLPRQTAQNRFRYRQRVLQESAQEADGGELQGQSEAVVMPAPGCNERQVSVIQMEKVRQLLRGRRPGITAVVLALLGGQETDRHGDSPCKLSCINRKFRDTGGEAQALLEIEGFCRPRAGCKSRSRN